MSLELAERMSEVPKLYGIKSGRRPGELERAVLFFDADSHIHALGMIVPGSADRQGHGHVPIERRGAHLAIIGFHIPMPSVEGDMIFPVGGAAGQRLPFGREALNCFCRSFHAQLTSRIQI